MTKKTIEVEWASGGTISPYTTAKKTMGHIFGEIPESDAFNSWWNEKDRKLNELKRESNFGFSDLNQSNNVNYNTDVDLYNKSLTQGGYAWDTNRNWNYVGSSPYNYLISTKPKEIHPFFHNERRLVAAIDATVDRLYIYDAETTLEISWTGTINTAIANSLYASGSWKPQSFCIDGLDFYITFTDTATAPDTHVVQCLTWDGVSTDSTGWSVKTGWAANGYALGTGDLPVGIGSAYYNFADLKNTQIINADENNIAVKTNFNLLGTTGTGIYIFPKAGGGSSSNGLGNYAASASDNDQLVGGFESDGTYIYFTVASSVSLQSIICACDISNASVYTGGMGATPRLVGSLQSLCKNILYIGYNRMICFCTYVGTPPIPTYLTMIQTLNTSATTGNFSYQMGEYYANGGARSNEWYLCGSNISASSYDGKYVYFMTSPCVDFGSTYYKDAIVKVHVSSFKFFIDTSQSGTLDELCPVVHYVSSSLLSHTTNNAFIDGMCCDGRDTWVTKIGIPSMSNRIMRIPHSAI